MAAEEEEEGDSDEGELKTTTTYRWDKIKTPEETSRQNAQMRWHEERVKIVCVRQTKRHK